MTLLDDRDTRHDTRHDTRRPETRRHQTRRLETRRPGPTVDLDGPGRLRVVVGADTFAPDVNGAARFTERLAAGLAARGHDVHVVSPSPDGGPRTQPFGAVTVHRLASVRTPVHESFRVARPWRVARDVDRLLDRLRPDVVHAQSHFPVSRSLAAAAARTDVPLVMTNHFMPENLFGHARVPAALQRAAAALAWRDLARVFGRAQVVTAPTPRAVELLGRAGGVHGARAVSCGIDLAGYGRTRAVDGPGPGPATVLFVGRLDEEKRVGELLRAVATLPARLPDGRDLHLEVVGEGSCRTDWEQLGASLGLGGRVVFRGRVDEADLRRAYDRAAVFCMPGVAELQSLATLEAMASGAPVVAADAMALPHLVEQGGNGWLYPPGDVAALADRLRRVLDDPDRAARLGRRSRELALAHDQDRTLETFEELYDLARAALGATSGASRDRSRTEP